MTLIELLATIGLMATAVVGLLGLFSTVEIGVSGTGDDAQLAAVARMVSDVIESESFAYVPCTGSAGQAPAGLTSYQTAIRARVTGPYTVSITAVTQAQSSGSQHTVSGTASPLQPIDGCSAETQSTGPDFGVQQLEFKVSSAHHSLTRVVYKRWN